MPAGRPGSGPPTGPGPGPPSWGPPRGATTSGINVGCPSTRCSLAASEAGRHLPKSARNTEPACTYAATSISESGRKLALQSRSLASMQSRKFCPPVLREIAHLLRVHVKALALAILVVAHA